MEGSVVQTMKEHQPKLVLLRHSHAAVHGTGPLGRFNTRLAVRITTSVGSMWCAYLFALLALISLPAAIRSGDPIIIVAWIAQTFLQLVLLPIIIVGQNVQAAATDARAQADHETLCAIHTLTSEVHTINEQQNVILNVLAERTEYMQGPTVTQGERARVSPRALQRSASELVQVCRSGADTVTSLPVPKSGDHS